MGSRVRIRLLHILHFVMDFLLPLLKNSKSGVDDLGHWLRICQAHRRVSLLKATNYDHDNDQFRVKQTIRVKDD